MFEAFGRTGPQTLGGGAILTLKIPYKLSCQFERLWDLDYGANADTVLMLQPDAFCEHAMQQNAFAAGAPTRTPPGELTTPPQSPS